MDRAPLYDEDIYAWSHHQARLLRDLKAASLRLPNELDLEHVAEEIEDLGNEQRFQVESNLEGALMYLIKLFALPEDPSARHWRKEINAFLHNARRRYRRSMRKDIDMADLWQGACRRVTQDFEADELALPALPAACPFALDDLLDRDADPLALVARLA